MCNLPLFWEIMTNRPADQQTDMRVYREVTLSINLLDGYRSISVRFFTCKIVVDDKTLLYVRHPTDVQHVVQVKLVELSGDFVLRS